MANKPPAEVEVEGVKFTSEIKSPATMKKLFLGGAGVRGIEAGGEFMAVTAIGIYLEAAAAFPAIAEKWKGKSAEELAGSADFYRDIITGPFEKLTKVTFLVPLTGQQFSGKVAENCVAGWKAAGAFTKEEEAAVDDFLQIFRPRSFPPGASVVYTHSPQGSLSIGFLDDEGLPAVEAVEAAAAAVIQNRNLTNAVLESIIGEHGVSPAAKQSLAQRIAEVLRRDDGEEFLAADGGGAEQNDCDSCGKI